jgi:hypothetical protein
MKNSIITIFILVVILFACSEGGLDYSSGNENSTGTGGSLARFTIAKNHLYTVDYSTLKVYDVTNEKSPVSINEIYIGFNIETIFAKGDLLFMGSSWGIYIYNISQPENPVFMSTFSHTYSCDPVVVSENYAYSTLSTSGPCDRGSNELDIINISDPYSPFLVKAITMDNPRGLGVSGNLLFVCDNGLKVFNITDKENPKLLKKIQSDAVDVIPIDTLLFVATEKGLSEYQITGDTNLVFLSTLY